MSSAQNQKKLRKLNERHHALIETMRDAAPMLRGSFTQVHTRCGKPTCWCARSPEGHPHTRLTWSQNGEMTTRKVPAEAIDEIKRLTGKYRQFRACRRELVRLQQQLQAVIGRQEESMVQHTRKRFRFLEIDEKGTPPQSGTRRKNAQMKKQMTSN